MIQSCISPMTKDIEDLCMYLLTKHISLVRCVFHCPFFKIDYWSSFSLLLLSCMQFLHVCKVTLLFGDEGPSP